MSPTVYSNFHALEEHFREEHPGIHCRPLSPGDTGYGYYLSFSGRRLRDIWAIARSKKSERLVLDSTWELAKTHGV